MSKYARQRARTDRRHGRVPKYTSGVQFPEKDPTVGGWEIAGSAGQGMSAGASLGAIAGPYGQAIGAVVGAGVGLGAGIAKRNATNRRNRRIEEAEKNYELYGNKATDPKLQMLQAEKGVQMNDSVEIEIEGKNGLGEIHTDADFNIKNVGTRPHTKGGDRVMAVEGDVVFPTQNSKKSFKEILGLINRAKQGDKEAEEELEERRKKLPEDDTDKYPDGTQGVKSREEQIKDRQEAEYDKHAAKAFATYDARQEEERSRLLALEKEKEARYDAEAQKAFNKYDNTYTPLGNGKFKDGKGNEYWARLDHTGTPYFELIQPIGPTVDLPGGVPSFNQRLPYEQPLSENGRNPYLTNSEAPKPTTWENFPENPYKSGYKSPLIPSMQVEPVLDTNGSPMLNPFTMQPFTAEELGVIKTPTTTPTPTGAATSGAATSGAATSGAATRRKGIQGKKPSTMTESDIVDFITGNQDVKNPAELAERAKAKGVPEELLLNTLDKIHKDFLPNATGTRNSTRPYGNIGPKTYSAFMLDKPTESIDYTDPTQEFKYPDAGIDPHSLDPFSVAPQSVATATKESAKRRVRDNLRNVGGNLRKQENSIMNTLASFEGIEGANPVNLNLERYAYEDMSQPAMREARKQRAIGRAAIQQGIGSRGQQVSYLTQNDAAVQDSIQKINEAEVARKLQIDNMNTDLTNKEKDFQAQDRLRIQDLLRRQRAAKRQFGQMASKERTERAYVDEQTDYMKSLDARKLERDMMLANLLREKNFDFTGVYDNEGNFNASNTTRYIK